MIRYKKPYIETLAAALARRRSVGDPAAPSQHHVALLRVAPPRIA
jgi:hypothetical protein